MSDKQNSVYRDIAERTGYKTTQYFGRKFKETYGVTPGEYRRAAGR